MIVSPSIRYKEQNPVYHFTDQFVNLIFFIVHESLSILALKCEGPKIQYNSPADVITKNNSHLTKWMWFLHGDTCSGMHKVAWRHFRHAVYTRIHVYASGHEKVSSGNLGSGTLADKTPAHWPRPTENWWSDPQSELLDWQNPETGPKLLADPRSPVFFKSTNPLCKRQECFPLPL